MIYLFIFGCTGSLAAWAVYPLAASGGSSLVAVCGFLTCVDFLQLQQVGALLVVVCGFLTCVEHRFQGAQPSVVVACGLSSCNSQALEHRLSSCGAWGWLLCTMWNLPHPGIKPVSPALAGGSFAIKPPGKL